MFSCQKKLNRKHVIFRSLLIIVSIILFYSSVTFAQVSDATALFVKENGNVGIGTEDPKSIFHIMETAKHPVIYFTRGDVSSIKDTKTWYFEMLGGDTNAFAISAGNDAYNSGVQALKIERSGLWPQVTSIVNGHFSVERGNIGIGTKDPKTKLHITQSANKPFVYLTREDVNFKDVKNWYFELHGGETNALSISTGNDTYSSGIQALSIERVGLQPKLTNIVNGDFSVERGKLGIGTINPTEKLHVIGNIKYTGKLMPPSDKRLKKNILNIEDPLKKICSINGVTFEWNDKNMGEKREIGVIAQEVENVFPAIVSTGTDGYKGVDYSKLVAPLIEAVKTLKNENEVLKAENNNITQRLSEIENLLNSLVTNTK